MRTFFKFSLNFFDNELFYYCILYNELKKIVLKFISYKINGRASS